MEVATGGPQDQDALRDAFGAAGGRRVVAVPGAHQGGTQALPNPDSAGQLSGDDISAALMAGSNQTSQSIGDDMLIDIAQVAGKVKHSSVRKIGELVAVHPDESITILRSWLHETA